MKKYKIYFVCRGNIYRSRLAEASLASMKLANFSVSSSGINSYENPGVSVASYGKSAAAYYHTSEYLSPQKIQTTQAMLSKADIIVFLERDIYEEAVKAYDINRFKCVIWDIKDMGERLAAKKLSINDVEAQSQEAIETYKLIQDKVKGLIGELDHVSWANIVDEENKPLGFRLPIPWANNYGLWRRSCHAIITTSDKKFLIEKRSKNIVFSPNKLDIGLGGGVDDGETPEAAVIREIREELGLNVQKDWIKLIDLHKWNTYHKHYNKFTRCFLYTYHVILPDAHPAIKLQKSEVASVVFISRQKLLTLLKVHRLTGLGTLQWGWTYFSKMVGLVSENL